MPLHIYEERYKLMISTCMTQAKDTQTHVFGISFIELGKLSNIGCLVKISEILHEYDDGQLDILTQGTQRYQLMHKYSEFAYLTASVQWVCDEMESIDAHLLHQVQNLYLQLFDILGQEPDENGPEPYSFRIGHQIGLEISDKQHLLEMTSENERLMMLYDHLHLVVPKIRETKEFNRRVRGNGHF